MKHLLLCLPLLLWLAACAGEKEKAEPDANPDTAALAPAAVDSVPADSFTPPAAADGLFDDFVYAFMRNRHFQLERVRFPLPVRQDGEAARPIARAAWKHDRLYADKEAYTMLFESERAVQREKDTTLRHVTVEWVYLKQRRVKQYLFEKLRGCWMLTAIDIHTLEHNANSDFYSFYARFSSDEGYQQRHVSNPFAFRTYDYDRFETLEGVLDAAQWRDNRPDLPESEITNINYGQQYATATRRVLIITSPSAGMSSTLVFKKEGGEWMLTRLENV